MIHKSLKNGDKMMIKVNSHSQSRNADKHMGALLIALAVGVLLLNDTGIFKTIFIISIGVLVAINYIPTVADKRKLWLYRVVVSVCTSLFLLSIYFFSNNYAL